MDAFLFLSGCGILTFLVFAGAALVIWSTNDRS